MEVKLYFKDSKRLEVYLFDDAEFERFKRDFEANAKSMKGTPECGSYSVQQYSTVTGKPPLPPRTLMVRFRDIVPE